MAVQKKKNAGQAPRGGNLIAAILSSVQDLLETHMSEGIIPLVEESEDHKATVSLKAIINCAETEPVVEVDIRYTSSVTDRRVTKLDNPDQGTFAPVVKEAEAETRKKVKKAIDGGEQPELPTGEHATGDEEPESAESEMSAPKKRGRPKKSE